MTLEEMRKIANGNKASNKVRKKPDDEEHRIQCECIRAFRYKYPNMNHNLFAVPNGGKRNKIIAGKMKAEGALAGVSDLIFLKSRKGKEIYWYVRLKQWWYGYNKSKRNE